MASAPILSLTDGVIRLHPLTQAYADAYFAGEDDELAKWLNGARSSPAAVRGAISRFEDEWRTGGPRRAFGVFDCDSHQLIGSVEANLQLLDNPADVNVSYGIFAAWRGRGLARRAVDLVSEYLRRATQAKRIVLQNAPENHRSIRVAEKAGFVWLGVFESAEGARVRYVREL